MGIQQPPSVGKVVPGGAGAKGSATPAPSSFPV